MIYDAIVLGAGISGLMIGRRLKELGKSVIIIDKGRSVGGRLATRRGDGTLYDHGAQFLTLEKIPGLSEGQLITWTIIDGQKSYVSPYGMNRVAKNLSEGLSVLLNSKVEKIENELVRLENGDSLRAKKIFISFPLPQTTDLLKASGLNIPQELAQVNYAMALVGLITIQTNNSELSSHGFSKPIASSIYSIANQKSKGMTDKVSLVVVMNDEFSRSYFSKQDLESTEAIKESLDIYFRQQYGVDLSCSIVSFDLKKWKYSHPLNPLGIDFYDLSGEQKIIITGDGLSGGSVARVINSAMNIPKDVLEI